MNKAWAHDRWPHALFNILILLLWFYVGTSSYKSLTWLYILRRRPLLTSWNSAHAPELMADVSAHNLTDSPQLNSMKHGEQQTVLQVLVIQWLQHFRYCRQSCVRGRGQEQLGFFFLYCRQSCVRGRGQAWVPGIPPPTRTEQLGFFFLCWISTNYDDRTWKDKGFWCYSHWSWRKNEVWWASFSLISCLSCLICLLCE